MTTRYLIPLFLFLLITTAGTAQKKLLLKSGIHTPGAIFEWPPVEAPTLGYHFRLVQFQDIPNPKQHELIGRSGIELLDYLPHNTYFAAIPEGLRPDWQQVGAIAVLDVSTEWKTDPGQVWKAENGKAEVLGTYYRNLDGESVRAAIEARGWEVTRINPTVSALAVSVPLDSLEAFARLPYIMYMEPMPPEPVPERQHYPTAIRSNYLSQVYGYDGSGLVLAVSEGRIHPALIDLQGRLDVSYHTANNSAGHATAVAQFMAGAGNENPLNKGMAYGADVISHTYVIWNNAPSLYVNPGLRISNQSWGAGCNAGYNGDARVADMTVRNLPHFMLVFSTGNSQTSDCGYGAGSGWGTITGGVKSGKNVTAVGALSRYDQLMGFSSLGPATDGRIKPDICAVGEGGTSFAAPSISGIWGQLHQAYMTLYPDEPVSGLIKAILQNTTDDLGNPGPDFRFGYGKANAKRAFETLEAGNFFLDSLTNNQLKTYAFTVPSGVEELRVMLHWVDFEGAANASKALVNDLDLSLRDPLGTTFTLPWVLDPTPDSAILASPAIRGIDTLNNMEQVTLLNPAPGTYQIRVNGTEVPMGPQRFYIVTHLAEEELTLTYPIEGEGFAPGEKEILRWDATGTGTFDLEVQYDHGGPWSPIASGIASHLRHYEWTIPDTLKGTVKIRIQSGSLSDTSNAFTISPVPQNVSVLWACADSLFLQWDSVPGASAYRITQLGARYMDSISTSSQPQVILKGLSTTDTLWFAVQALAPDGAVSRRSIAIRKNPGNQNCVFINVGAELIISHPNGFLPDCQTGPSAPLGVRLRNSGVNAVSGIPVRYRINGGPVSTGSYSPSMASGGSGDFFFPTPVNFSFLGTYHVQIWTDMPGDPDVANDTTEITLTVYPGQTILPLYIQDFDTFQNCNSGWGCSGISCSLSAGWFNVPNLMGDSSDFRTHNGGTGSANTGPSNDHTQGTAAGKYIFIETSGNGGAGCAEQIVLLHSPCIDLTNTYKPSLSFWYHMFGWSIGELHIDVLSNGQWVTDIVPPLIGDQGNNWLQQVADLSAFTDETIVIRFRADTRSGFGGDMALDDIEIHTLPKSNFTADRQTICVNDEGAVFGLFLFYQLAHLAGHTQHGGLYRRHPCRQSKPKDQVYPTGSVYHITSQSKQLRRRYPYPDGVH